MKSRSLADKAMWGREARLVEFCLDRFGDIAGFLNESRDHRFNRRLRKVPKAGQLEQGDAVFVGNGTQSDPFSHARLHPAGGTKRTVILGREFVARLNVIVKQAAVIHHAGNEATSCLTAAGRISGRATAQGD